MDNRSMLIEFMSILETFGMDCEDDCGVVVSSLIQDGDDLLIRLEANDGTTQSFRMIPTV